MINRAYQMTGIKIGFLINGSATIRWPLGKSYFTSYLTLYLKIMDLVSKYKK